MGILKQAEGGTPVFELCREHGMSSASFYKWRAKFGGMDASLITERKDTRVPFWEGWLAFKITFHLSHAGETARGVGVDPVNTTSSSISESFRPKQASEFFRTRRRCSSFGRLRHPHIVRVIREINHDYDPHFDSIIHIDRKYLNNRIESDHAVLKRLLGYRQIFRSLRSAKATLAGMEAIRTIKRGHIHNK